MNNFPLTFGAWTVFGVVPRTHGKKCYALCECGTLRVAYFQPIRNGHVRGCLACKPQKLAVASTKHGHTGNGVRSGAYRSWDAMIQRCTNSSNRKWPNYGGRGIKVCESWLAFEGFYADMGDRPARLTLDRIDNSWNYEPWNCRWTTYKVQNNNRRPAVRNRRSEPEPEWAAA